MTSEDSMADPTESPHISLRVSDLNLSDYYTIASVLDQSPDDRGNILTSFSNPNYGLDALNSNLFVTSSYDDDDDDNKFRCDVNGVDKMTSSTDDDEAPPSTGSSRNSGSRDDQEPMRSTRSSVEGDAAEGRGFEAPGGPPRQEKPRGGGDGGGGDAVEMGVVVVVVDAVNGNVSGSTKIQKTKTVRESKENREFKDIYSPDSNDSGIQVDVSQTLRNSPSSFSSSSDPTTCHFSKDEGRVTVENANNLLLGKTSPETNELSTSAGDIYECNEAKAEAVKQINPVHGADLEDAKVIDHLSKETLPPGWQKHEDISGAYYWHIKSGTIQRERPSTDQFESANQHDSKISTKSKNISINEDPAIKRTSQTDTMTSGSSQSDGEERSRMNEEDSFAVYPMRFAVRSLGWVQISEDDLTPERSSRSVNKCIVGLSLGKNDLNDVVGRWGDGKSLYMELDEENLVLIDPQDMCILNIQPIQSIRVWGVGRSNGRERDFAYVARDGVTHRHMCHVFRCDGLARHIAGALRDVCKKILTERTLRHQRASSSSSSSSLMMGHHQGSTTSGIIRPNNLPNLERIRDPPNGQHLTFDSLYKNTSFPTPMEEPKKVLRCHYLGTTQVLKPTGVEILNSAIENVYMRLPPDKWTYVNVAVAPSTITITEHGKPENVFAECRVRFLSFMGIAMNNIRLCSYIMHCAEDQFIAHIFHCDPSAGALCKTIEAACKLRYQKCLDAHLRCRPFTKNQIQERQAKGRGLTFRQSVQTVIGNLTKGCKPKS